MVNAVVVTVVLGPVVLVEPPLVVVSRVIVLDVVLPPDGDVEVPVPVPGPVGEVEAPVLVPGPVGEVEAPVLVPGPVGEVEAPVLVPGPVGDIEVLVPGPVLTPVGPVTVAVEVPVAPVDVPEGGVLELDGGAAQAGAVITLVSNVTAPVLASSRPVTVAPVCAVTDCLARTVPTNVELVPRVADDATCQKTLHEACWVVNVTTLLEAVIRVLEAWKMKTASGSVLLSRVTVPERLRLPW